MEKVWPSPRTCPEGPWFLLFLTKCLFSNALMKINRLRIVGSKSKYMLHLIRMTWLRIKLGKKGFATTFRHLHRNPLECSEVSYSIYRFSSALLLPTNCTFTISGEFSIYLRYLGIFWRPKLTLTYLLIDLGMDGGHKSCGKSLKIHPNAVERERERNNLGILS